MASRARCVSVLVLMLAMAAVVAADPKSTCSATFPVAGRKFTLKNRPPLLGGAFVCPEGNPSTVTFCKAGKKVKIVGYFSAADLGVCDSEYAVKPTDVVTYEQYGDMAIIRIIGRGPSAFRAMVLEGKKVAVGLGSYGVTTMTDSGPANC